MSAQGRTPTGGKSLLGVAGERLRNLRHLHPRTKLFIQMIVRFLLVVAGLTAISASAWLTFGIGAGLLISGFSLLLIEWMVKR